ncbi:MAG: DUF2752 domain-containing protein [Clostridia bacterium]|nr:DUF2752 domain-containing protein [Clostridia bacterium]
MRLKTYIRMHFLVLAVALAFGVYGYLTLNLLPSGSYHCFMHDLLRLYCPLCGGTRAFLCVLRFDALSALRYNAAVCLAALGLLVLDARALYLILRGRGERPFPAFILPVGVCWFVGYTVLLNGLLFFGIDPVGDLLPYWQHLTPLMATLATLLLALLALSFLAALLLPRRWRWLWWLTGVLAILLPSLLKNPLWLLLLLPLGILRLVIHIIKKKAVQT